VTVPSFFPPPSQEEQLRYFKEFLEQRGIDPELAKAYDFQCDVANNINRDYKLTKTALFYNELGIRMPFHGFDWEILPHREATRRSNPPKDDKGKIQSKYVRMNGVIGSCLYLTYREDWEEVRNNIRIPLLNVEGEFKAVDLSLRISLDYAVTGISGNNMFIIRNRHNGAMLVPQLWDGFEINGRDVILVPDADRKEETTQQTWDSMRKTAANIYSRGGKPWWIDLKKTEAWQNNELDKMGVDDYFQTWNGSVKEFWSCKELLAPEGPRYMELRDEWYFCNFPQGFVHKYTGEFVADARWNSRVDNYIDNMQTSKGIAPVKASKQFREATDRPTVRGITFIPNGDPLIDGFYNSWSGWSDYSDISDVSIIDDFLQAMFTLCGEPEANRVLDFMAHTFQFPEQRPQHAFLLKSPHTGTGKSTMCRIFKNVAGEYGVKASGTEFYGRFNGWARDKLVVWLDEIKSSDMTTNQTTEKLNDFITMPEISIESKGVDTYAIPFYARLIMASNDPAPVHMKGTERRTNVIGCLPCADNKEHIARLKRLNNLTAAQKQALLDWFLDRDISSYDPASRAVLNEHSEKIIELGRTAAEDYASMFIDECIEQCNDCDGVFYKMEWALAWCENRGYKRGRTELGKAIDDESNNRGYYNQTSSTLEQVQISGQGKGRWLSLSGKRWMDNPKRSIFALCGRAG
jgi:hypothetical protein